MILFGEDELISEWVALKLGMRPHTFKPCKALGVIRNGRLAAGVIYNNYHEKNDGSPLTIQMTVASIDKRWCQKEDLRVLFSYPFAQLGLERVQALCSAKNQGVQMFLEKLGFKKEGYHPLAYDDGSDAISYGMLKSDCRWL